jgi:hypothetical protein
MLGKPCRYARLPINDAWLVGVFESREIRAFAYIGNRSGIIPRRMLEFKVSKACLQVRSS